VKIGENVKTITASVEGVMVTFNSEYGTIKNIYNKNGLISLSDGPVPVGVESEIIDTNWGLDPYGNFKFEIFYKGYPHKVTWILQKMVYCTLKPISYKTAQE